MGKMGFASFDDSPEEEDDSCPYCDDEGCYGECEEEEDDDDDFDLQDEDFDDEDDLNYLNRDLLDLGE